MDIANLEIDLMKSDQIKHKCKNSVYAQNLYAALCNNRFFKNTEEWTCSWRMAGRIVADLRDCGEGYLDWYCSGISDHPNCMPEGCISKEIREDLLELGWDIEPYNCHQDKI